MQLHSNVLAGRIASMDLRVFLKDVTAPAAVTAGLPALGAKVDSLVESQKMIGLQVGAVSFADEGAGKLLDEVS
jgi:hypothetical protein